jgi:hypothetical protein
MSIMLGVWLLNLAKLGRDIHHQIDQTKRAILSVANTILQHNFFGIVLAPAHLVSACPVCRSSKRDKVAEDLISVVNGFLNISNPEHDSHFIRDFSKKYFLQARLHQVKQVSNEVHVYPKTAFLC